MWNDTFRRTVVIVLTGALLALFRQLAPGRSRGTERPCEQTQKPEPLPTGAVEGIMLGLGILPDIPR